MKIKVNYSTIFVFILSQTIISIPFYLNDHFITGLEAILTFVFSVPATYLIQWLRGVYKPKVKDYMEENNYDS